MGTKEISCPEFHVWFIIVTSKESVRLKCKFCAAEVKVYRDSNMSPTAQVQKINADPIARQDPYKYPTPNLTKAIFNLMHPETVFDEKVR